MTSHTPRLPAFAEYAPQGSTTGGNSRIRIRGTHLSEFIWLADASIDLRVARPTPIVDRLSVQVNLERWIEALGCGWSLLPHHEGVLACHRTPSSLTIVFAETFNVAPLAFELRLTPVLNLVTAAKSVPVDEDLLNRTIRHCLPLHQLAGNVGWRLDRGKLYAECLDAGWNLPISRDAGGFILKEQRGDLSLIWDANRGLDVAEPSHIRFDDEVEASLRAYRRGEPARSVLLSAAAMSDTRSAFLSMLVSAEAARRDDQNTLRIMRVAHQRALDRGRMEFGGIGTLLTCNAALGDLDKATKIVPALETILRGDARLADAADWVSAHIQALLFSDNVVTIGDVTPTERGVMDTPPVSIEAVAQRVRSGSSPAVEPASAPIPPITRPSTDTPHTLSRVELARLDSRRYSAEFAAVDQLSPDEAFAKSIEAFENDEDVKAWELIRAALRKNGRIPNQETASVVLRLYPRNTADNLARKALQAVIESPVDPTSRSRAAVLLAQLHRQAGENPQALQVLEDCLRLHPDDIAIQVERAQLLTQFNPSAAIVAWRKVLDSGLLEPWEAHKYRQVLTTLLKGEEHNDARLHELRRLHADDPGNPELTKTLASQLEEIGAIDEAISVRARHACNISQLKGYPSVALVVQAINSQRPMRTQAAIACAHVIHLASTIATPDAWLHRAMLTLAERHHDPLILEYAIFSARKLQLPEIEAALQKALADYVPIADRPRTPSRANLAVPTTAASAPVSEHDSDAPMVVEDTSPQVRSIQSLVPDLIKLFPPMMEGSLDEELNFIQQSVVHTRGAAQRAALLGRRAAILLEKGDAPAASQAWTGSTILLPDDPKTLAGLTIARALSSDLRAAEISRQHFLKVIKDLDGAQLQLLPTSLVFSLTKLRFEA